MQAFVTVAVGQFPDSLFKPIDGFGVDPDFRLPVHVEEGKVEEFAQPRTTDRTFFLVYLESEYDG